MRLQIASHNTMAITAAAIPSAIEKPICSWYLVSWKSGSEMFAFACGSSQANWEWRAIAMFDCEYPERSGTPLIVRQTMAVVDVLWRVGVPWQLIDKAVLPLADLPLAGT